MSCRRDMHPRNLRFGDKGLKPARFPILKEGIFRTGKKIKIPPFLKGGRGDFSAEAYTVGAASRSVEILSVPPPKAAAKSGGGPTARAAKNSFRTENIESRGAQNHVFPGYFWFFTVMSTCGLDFCPKIQNRFRQD